MSQSALDFPLWKKLFTLAICAYFGALALPNFISEDITEQWPDWAPKQRVNLGLDLQGGSHLLLEVDVDSVANAFNDSLRSSLRRALREPKIGYTELKARDNGVYVTVRPETFGDDTNIRRLLADVSEGVQVEALDAPNRYRVYYDEPAVAGRRDRLVAQTIDIIARRIDQTGTKEPVIQRQGDDRVLLQVPGVEDPAELKNILGTTAKMTFHMVNHNVSQDALMMDNLPLGTIRIGSHERDGYAPDYAIISEPALSGDMLVDANPSVGEFGDPVVAFRFNGEGARIFGDITRANRGKQFAVVLDGKVITAPRINGVIAGGSGIIEGSFTQESAAELSLLLRAGALPADVRILEERSVGPSLGADSIAAGTLAAMVAIGLVAVFMVVSYGVFGLLSVCALAINLLLLLGALSLLQATLTLPGIAGIILTLGMAVDANVLIFERIREEAAKGRSVRVSIDKGFSGAFGTILDSNITTLIAAFVLFYFGSGTVKGFAVTLSFGILSSMFTAILLTRLLVITWLSNRNRQALPI